MASPRTIETGKVLHSLRGILNRYIGEGILRLTEEVKHDTPDTIRRDFKILQEQSTRSLSLDATLISATLSTLDIDTIDLAEFDQILKQQYELTISRKIALADQMFIREFLTNTALPLNLIEAGQTSDLSSPEMLIAALKTVRTNAETDYLDDVADYKNVERDTAIAQIHRTLNSCDLDNKDHLAIFSKLYNALNKALHPLKPEPMFSHVLDVLKEHASLFRHARISTGMFKSYKFIGEYQETLACDAILALKDRKISDEEKCTLTCEIIRNVAVVKKTFLSAENIIEEDKLLSDSTILDDKKLLAIVYYALQKKPAHDVQNTFNSLLKTSTPRLTA